MEAQIRFGAVTIFTEMFGALTDYGITGRAVREGRVALSLFDPREHAGDRHRTVDDRPYGGGPGMLMKVEPLKRALDEARAALAGARVLYLSPQGRRFDQAAAAELLERGPLIFLCGRYEGVDERLIAAEVDEEWSLGDYVLSGGELAAMAMMDAMIRLVPGALGHEQSAEEDSFADGLLDCPHYTRPELLEGAAVPAVLLSGDHAAIRRWRLKQALGRTWQRRPRLLERRGLSDEERELLAEFRRELADETG